MLTDIMAGISALALVLPLSQATYAGFSWTADNRRLQSFSDTTPTALGASQGFTSSHSETDTNGPGDFSRWVIGTEEDSRLVPFDGSYFHFLGLATATVSGFNGNLITTTNTETYTLKVAFNTTDPVDYLWTPTSSGNLSFYGPTSLSNGSTTLNFQPDFVSQGTLVPGTWTLISTATTHFGSQLNKVNFDFAVTPEPSLALVIPAALLIYRPRRSSSRA